MTNQQSIGSRSLYSIPILDALSFCQLVELLSSFAHSHSPPTPTPSLLTTPNLPSMQICICSNDNWPSRSIMKRRCQIGPDIGFAIDTDMQVDHNGIQTMAYYLIGTRLHHAGVNNISSQLVSMLWARMLICRIVTGVLVGWCVHRSSQSVVVDRVVDSVL